MAKRSSTVPKDLMDFSLVEKYLRPNCLADKKALITGARAHSIGYAIALVLGKYCGAEIYIHAEDRKTLSESTKLLKLAGVNSTGYVADFRKQQNGKLLGKQVAREHGAIDLLVNNAGWTLVEDYLELSQKQIEEVFSLNLLTPNLLTQALLPGMLKAGAGRIICLSSVHAHRAATKAIPYAMTKAAILAWVRGLATRFGPEGIRAFAVSPGWIQVKRHFDDAEVERAMIAAGRSQPVRRIAKPTEVAGLVAFLCTELADYANGSEVVFDGGRIKQLN